MRVIELTKGHVAIVDDEDFDRVAQYRWCYSGNGYAVRGTYLNGKRKLQLMHRFILGLECDEKEVDHRSGNGLDNRRCNIRVGTKRQNAYNQTKKPCNTSGHKGVYLVKKSGMYAAQIRIEGKNTYLGAFETAKEAAAAYDAAALQHHGEFACLNSTARN